MHTEELKAQREPTSRAPTMNPEALAGPSEVLLVFSKKVRAGWRKRFGVWRRGLLASLKI